MTDHDGIYHRPFSHPAMVAQLLREFVAGPWLEELDLDGMVCLNAKFHAETGKRRDGDMIWRIPRHGGGNTYLVRLLAFQSKSARWMALRALIYAGLLWQHLEKEKQLQADGKLPPILPVVLYSGEQRWAAPLAQNELIGLADGSTLWKWQPDLRDFVIDEGSFDDPDLATRDGLPALLFRLENLQDQAQLLPLTKSLQAAFARYPALAAMRKVFAELKASVMVPLAAGGQLPVQLSEQQDMIEGKAHTWIQQWLAEGSLTPAAWTMFSRRDRAIPKLAMSGRTSRLDR